MQWIHKIYTMFYFPLVLAIFTFFSEKFESPPPPTQLIKTTTAPNTRDNKVQNKYYYS